MKKRILSALLALVMVLALLPATTVTAFAAVEYGTISSDLPSATVKTYEANGTTPKTYYYQVNPNGSITTVTVQRFAGGNDGTNRVYGHWYWLNNRDSQNPVYHEVTSGYITGDNGSGQWYPDINAFTTTSTGTFEGTAGTMITKLRSSTLTLLGAVNLDMSSGSWSDTSLRVDIEGTGTLTLAQNASSVTVTSKFQSTQTGTVAAITRDHSAYSTKASGNAALRLDATNVNVGAIDLTGRANTVALHNCAAAGISMAGSYYSSATAANPTWAGQNLTLDNGTTVAGAIVVNGDSNNVKIADTTAVTQTLTVTGNGPIAVSGRTTLGDIAVTARGATGAYPTVSVSGGTVGAITQGTVTGNKNSITVNVSNTNTQTGAITVDKGTVNLTNGNVNGDVTVKAGALNANSSSDNVHVSGKLILGDKDKTTLNLAATNSTYGGITVANGSNLTINGWNGNRLVEGKGSNYGVLDLTGYTGRGITGGSFANTQVFETVAKMKWLNANVQFYVKNATTGTTDLYDANELARAISDITTDTAKVAGNIIVVGQMADRNIKLYNGQNLLAKIGYNATTGLIMPESINGMQIAQWYAPGNNNIILPSGVVQGVPYDAGNDLTLNASGVTAEAKKLTNVSLNATTTVENQNIRVALNGNNIALSGAVMAGAGNIATIYVDLTTDAVDEQGNVIKLQKVAIDYYPATKQVKFNMIQPSLPAAGGIIQDQGATLALNNGTGEKYTVSANLAVSAETLQLYMGNNSKSPIVVTTGGKLSSWTALERQALIDQIQKNGTFTIGSNRAVLEAINAAQATITSDNSVSSWITNAKNTIWRQGYKSPDTTLNTAPSGFAVKDGVNLTPNTGAFDSSATQGGKIAELFSTAYVVPYLVVNITDYDRNGALTATLTPYYRVDVSGATYDPDFYYTVQAGRAMSALTGTMCPNGVEVDLGLPATFNTLKMHQDGKYVYTGAGGVWTITHAGTNGLGSIVINNIDGTISLDGTAANSIANRVPTIAQLRCTYDNLQAAIDDTVRGVTVQNVGAGFDTYDTVKIGGAYTGECNINMTGIARKVKVVAEGQQKVTTNGKNVDVQDAGGFTYMIQLKQDAVAAGSVAIAVNGADNGTAVASTAVAKAGQTVTITATPKAGYSTLGMTAVGNGNVTVPVTGSGNSWSFKVPENVTSITVTPRFGIGGQATVSVNNNTNGSAIVAGNANTVAQGSTVTVYTTPKAGYRATGVSVRFSNGTTVNATNTGTNTWSFSVPANVTTVSITPSFSVDTGLPFLDVAATEYYLPYVKFVYNHGMMKGDGNDYTFNGNGRITRGQIVTILYRLQGSPVVALNTSFKDVPANEYYAYPVAWAAASGVVNGRNTTTFDPNAAITRQELAAILYRYNNFRGLSSGNLSNLSQFTDRGYVDNYALTPMQWAVGNGIITGTNPNTLSPDGTATRYQAATMLTRYCQTFLKMV